MENLHSIYGFRDLDPRFNLCFNHEKVADKSQIKWTNTGVFVWRYSYLQRNALLEWSPGRCGDSCVTAVGYSLFSMHTAYGWERKKLLHSATVAYMKRKGLVHHIPGPHSLSTPKYLQSNLKALRRQQRLKLFLICHCQACKGDAWSPGGEVQACCIRGPHYCIAPGLHASPMGCCGGTAVPCKQDQVNGKAQARSDMGNSWVLREGGGCSPGIAVGCPPCPMLRI